MGWERGARKNEVKIYSGPRKINMVLFLRGLKKELGIRAATYIKLA